MEGKQMGEQTTLSIATTGKESLRTTVPMSLIKRFKLGAGDKLDWEFDVKDGELVVIIRPLKASDGLMPLDKPTQTA